MRTRHRHAYGTADHGMHRQLTKHTGGLHIVSTACRTRLAGRENGGKDASRAEPM